MHKIAFLFSSVLSILSMFSFAQSNSKPAVQTEIARPKLIVGIVVDQMRWDYLYRYYKRYSSNGFQIGRLRIGERN